MTPEQQDKLTELREKIPVGIKYGMELLESNQWDTEKAASQFKLEVIQRLADKENVDLEIARKYAEIHIYDFAKSLAGIQQEIYTLSERILKKGKNKEDALGNIAVAIEETGQLKRDFWIKKEEFHKLNARQYTFLLVWEWLSYADWESFDVAIDLEMTGDVEKEIKKSLGMTSIATIIFQAIKRKSELLQQEKVDVSTASGYCTFTNSLRDDAQFSDLYDRFNQNRANLVDALYAFVKNNSADFP